MKNQKVGTLLGTIILIIVAVSTGVFLWKYEKEKGIEAAIPVQQLKAKDSKETIKIGGNFNQDALTYENKKYGFKMNLPEELKNEYVTYSNPVKYEVGQADKCVDCSLIQFVVPTKDLNSCPFPGMCGKAILFVIWVRDITSWNNNHNNNSYACIGESNVIRKTNNYVYSLCPFNAGDNEKSYYPEDSFELLEKTLPIIKSSFTLN